MYIIISEIPKATLREIMQCGQGHCSLTGVARMKHLCLFEISHIDLSNSNNKMLHGIIYIYPISYSLYYVRLYKKIVCRIKISYFL